jgi:hypothetical protein
MCFHRSKQELKKKSTFQDIENEKKIINHRRTESTDLIFKANKKNGSSRDTVPLRYSFVTLFHVYSVGYLLQDRGWCRQNPGNWGAQAAGSPSPQGHDCSPSGSRRFLQAGICLISNK